MKILSLLSIVASLLVSSIACHQESQSGPVRARVVPEPAHEFAIEMPKPEAPVPESVSNLNARSEFIFDLARDKNWAQAQLVLDELKRNNTNLPTERQYVAGNVEYLDRTMTMLENAIAQNDSWNAMRAANALSLLATRMSAEYNRPVPVELAMLKYHARELIIFAQSKDKPRLMDASSNIWNYWNRLRPGFTSRGYESNAIRFDSLISDLNQAYMPEMYEQIGNRMLNELEVMQKIYLRGT